MASKEKIKVWIDFQDGEIKCLCHRAKKKCQKKCTREVVEFDRYYGWEETFHTDKYGRNKPK